MITVILLSGGRCVCRQEQGVPLSQTTLEPPAAVPVPVPVSVPTPVPGAATGFGSSRAAGFAALVATVVLWSAFALSDRALVGSTLRPADAALIRYGTPLLLLAPALWRRRRQYLAVSPAAALKIVIGGGVPFYLAAMYGGSLTTAAFVGALVPGMVPLFIAARGVRTGQAPKGLQATGLALIALGVAALVAPDVAAVDTRILTGCGLLLCASGLWSLYTVGLREVSLDPVGSAGLLCLPTFAVMLLLVLTGVLPTDLVHAAPGDLLLFLAVQGVGSGVCSGLLYAFAIRRLGPRQCSTVGSLSPALTAVLAVPLLGESLTVAVLAGIPLIAFGVLLANRLPGTRASS
jgi:drug/metabolite transporter (DMT)-like permease